MTYYVCTTLAANSWYDEQDIGSPSYDTPVYQPPLFSYQSPPIYGTKFFGNAPTYRYIPAPPVHRPAPTQPKPPQMKDATILCAAILCSAPATCRLIQPCPTCRPQATCLAPASLPPNFDQCCQMYGYKQAVMLHHLLPPVAGATLNINPSTAISLRCIPWLPALTRGGCSPGTACVPYTQPEAPAGTGTCCAGLMPTVPPPASRQPASSQAVPPPAAATHAQQPNPVPPAPLVNSAAATVPTIPRSLEVGSCPSVNYLMSTCTGKSCTRDSQCGFYLKCCPSSCGRSTCTVPSLPASGQTNSLQG
ncbi:hypothetical protein PoB_003395500 [Plakobranchus ocellatus]|uniref:WAP domain-containing protein n=1 Tax=Plakobranchus ocellatus TaxID=259542 RepID=A0AAV4AGZ1_9GAST|nr:hypothetical protein PoB_003395500 [Plakobranchus ocellatus]